MVDALLKFKDIEHLLRKQIPLSKIKKWTNEGAIVNLNFRTLKPQQDVWQGMKLYQFEGKKNLEEVKFLVICQPVGDVQEWFMVIE